MRIRMPETIGSVTHTDLTQSWLFKCEPRKNERLDVQWGKQQNSYIAP